MIKRFEDLSKSEREAMLLIVNGETIGMSAWEPLFEMGLATHVVGKDGLTERGRALYDNWKARGGESNAFKGDLCPYCGVMTADLPAHLRAVDHVYTPDVKGQDEIDILTTAIQRLEGDLAAANETIEFLRRELREARHEETE